MFLNKDGFPSIFEYGCSANWKCTPFRFVLTVDGNLYFLESNAVLTLFPVGDIDEIMSKNKNELDHVLARNLDIENLGGYLYDSIYQNPQGDVMLPQSFGMNRGCDGGYLSVEICDVRTKGHFLSSRLDYTFDWFIERPEEVKKAFSKGIFTTDAFMTYELLDLKIICLNTARELYNKCTNKKAKNLIFKYFGDRQSEVFDYNKFFNEKNPNFIKNWEDFRQYKINTDKKGD
jgi:hypothetical protein